MPPPVRTRLSLVSPELTLAVDPARLRALLESCYAPQLTRLVSPARTEARRLASARALWGRPVPLLVADVFDELARLATPSGRDALVEAACDTGQEHAGWEDEVPVELAARLLADRIALHAVLVRAHLRLARLPPERPTYELRGAEPRRVPANRAGALADALRDVATGGGRAWSDAWVHEDDESGDVHAVVLRAAPSEGPGVRRADAFRFRVAEGRLALTTWRPQRVDAYAAAWGRAVYGDEHFFLRAPSLTLKPLLALGAAGIAAAALPIDVVRARVVACHLDTGGADRLETQGPHALARLAPQLRDGGHLTRATLRFDIAGELRPVDAAIQLPYRLDVGPGGVAGSGARGARIAREAVARLGLLSPGAMADDVTTLLPLLHGEWRWRELVGEDGVAAMLAAEVLDHVDGPRTRRAAIREHRQLAGSGVALPLFPRLITRGEIDPDAPDYERNLAVAITEASERMHRKTAYYFVPDDWASRAVTLQQEDMAMLRLSLGALLRKGRKEMGLARGEKPRLPKGVLWVGELAVEGGVVRFFYVVRAAREEKERAAIGRAVTKAAGFARAVVLVPEGRKMRRDYLELELSVAEQLGAAGWSAKVREAVKALGIEEKVPAELLAPAGARLIVDKRRERIVLDGVVLEMPDGARRLVTTLAERAGGSEPAPSKVTDKAISGARASEGATRNVVYRMPRWIEKSFAAAGKSVPEDVKERGLVRFEGKKGWVLTVRGAVG